MARPNIPPFAPRRARIWAERMARQREQESRWRQQWELHAKQLREQTARGHRQAFWESHHTYQQSMSAYHRQRRRGEWRGNWNLEERRGKLRVLFEEDRKRLEAELKEKVAGRGSLASQLMQKTKELHSVRMERRKKLAQELLKEHWKKNNPELRKFESTMHKDYVVSKWQEQISEKRKQEAAELEEKRRFENECERNRKEAVERMKEAEEKKRAEECRRAEELRKQMEELKLREDEATRLKKVQEALLLQQWELEKMEEERLEMEERRKKCEMRHFLTRQYRAQLKRRAQLVQEELEADRKILAALLKGEDEDKRLEAARRERAIADAAWMKRVIEEQLHLERQREAEFEILHREDAQRVWEKREAQWEKERKARERLMREVLVERQQQLELKVQKNREAQENSLRRREELIRELEMERELRRRETQEVENLRTARREEIDSQVEQKLQEQREEQCREEEEEKDTREALRIQEEELKQEMQRMAREGYKEKIHSKPRSAWM